ncbi:Plastocyanin-like domain-containing protein [Heracleum sosnowskyi]|uniref:Plastocyanin-like domain-containing protein n=1 Tax=Heracleum sosnowskyi TaxID=360622 RepID=A0AAD8J192_9APIA|nr:Plastocyanin-like domain-containing protein [Heracleum sosnowskyi]
MCGSLRVALPDGNDEPFSYDYDRSIILTDWYHKSTYEQATGLSSIMFVWVGEPQSLLIQGKGRFNYSLPSAGNGVCNATNPECSPYVLTVVSGKNIQAEDWELDISISFKFRNRDIWKRNMLVVYTRSLAFITLNSLHTARKGTETHFSFKISDPLVDGP